MFAWPSGIGAEGALWLDSGAFTSNVHVRGAALRKNYDGTWNRDIAAYAGAYGIQLGAALGGGPLRPVALVGFERVGSVYTDNELNSGSGRTEDDLTLELGVRFPVHQTEFHLAVRGAIALDQSAATTHPPGPPLPVMTFLWALRL
jgi:hypothetical protein